MWSVLVAQASIRSAQMLAEQTAQLGGGNYWSLPSASWFSSSPASVSASSVPSICQRRHRSPPRGETWRHIHTHINQPSARGVGNWKLQLSERKEARRRRRHRHRRRLGNRCRHFNGGYNFRRRRWRRRRRCGLAGQCITETPTHEGVGHYCIIK